MLKSLVFRRTEWNANSLAALAQAAASAQSAEEWKIEIADQLESCAGARVAAFSFATPELEAVLDEVRALRRTSADTLIIAGGPHPSVDPEGVLRLGFDAVFVGEGELTLPEFLDQVAAGRTLQPVWRAARAFDIDSRLHVATRWGLFPFVEITRGCPHACAFCSTSIIFGRHMRHRSPEVVAEGVRQAVRAGYRRFRLLSPDAFAYGGGQRRERAQRLEELLVRCREAGASEIILGTYPSEVRPERVNAQVLQVVKKYCRNRRVQIGAQAGSDRVLSLMRRGHTVEQVRQAVRRVREAGLQPMLDVILGFPGETFGERRATLELVRWLLEFSTSRVHLHWYTPLPGSAAWPAPPEKPEPAVVEELEQLSRSRRVSGQWREQLALGQKIMSWRRTGLLS